MIKKCIDIIIRIVSTDRAMHFVDETTMQMNNTRKHRTLLTDADEWTWAKRGDPGILLSFNTIVLLNVRI